MKSWSIVRKNTKGLPCIASNVGAILELLLAEDTVGPRNIEEFAQKITEMIRNPERLHQMVPCNLERAKEYRSSELNKRGVEFCNKAVEKTKAWHRS